MGEARNPGPPRGAWCGADGARYKEPHVPGFWQARAPGHLAPPRHEASDSHALNVVTVNATSWQPLQRFLSKTEADIVLAQEHHLPPDKIASCSAWALRQGWHSIFLPAEATPAGGWSAGVAIFARPHMAISLPRDGGEEVVPHRVVAACVEPPGHRPCLVVSAYLEDGKGLAEANLAHLAAIGGRVEAQGPHHPFIVGGDFQMEPSRIAVTGVAHQMGATLVATAHPRGTCRSTRTCSELDYFLVHSALALGIDEVATVEHAGTTPHVPVSLRFHPRITSARALFLRLPPPLPTERVLGPVLPPPPWEDLRRMATELAARARDPRNVDASFDADYERLFSLWADRAEEEIFNATGYQGNARRGRRGKRPRLVWRSIVPERPPKPIAPNVTWWRVMANVANDLTRLTLRQLPAGDDEGPRVAADAYAGTGGQEPGAQAADCVRLLEHFKLEDAEDTEQKDALDLLRAAAILVAAALDVGGESDWPAAGRRAEADEQHEDDPGRVAAQRVAAARIAAYDGLAKAAAVHAADADAQWKSWVLRNLDAGAKNAHKFLKLPETWRPTTVMTTDGVLTADPLRLLDGHRAKHAKLWGACEEIEGDVDGGGAGPPHRAADHERPWRSGPPEALARPATEELREASRSFPHETLTAYDGISMRHFDLLSNGALEVLCDIFEVLELTADLPPQLRLTTMPLIAKARGGHRAIAAFPSLYRLWVRVRRDVVRRWEEENDHAFIAAGTGRGPQDAVWRQAARCEAAVGEGSSAATLL